MLTFRSKNIDSGKVYDKLADMKGQTVNRIHIEYPKTKENDIKPIVNDISKIAKVTVEESDRKTFKTTIYHTDLVTKRRH